MFSHHQAHAGRLSARLRERRQPAHRGHRQPRPGLRVRQGRRDEEGEDEGVGQVPRRQPELGGGPGHGGRPRLGRVLGLEAAEHRGRRRRCGLRGEGLRRGRAQLHGLRARLLGLSQTGANYELAESLLLTDD